MNRAGQQILFSIYHMNDKNMYSYVDALNRFQPKWIQGYPSAVSLLASFITRTGYGLKYKVEVITLSSENVTEHQREQIKKAFSIYPNQTYGQTEAVAYFSDCIPGDIYVIEDYSGVEFVQMDDGETHIVGTGFWNKAMPLIRYDTHDIANCEETAYGRKVVSIDGRQEDYISTPEGSKIGRLDHIFKNAGHVIEAQIIQKSNYEVRILIVKSSVYNKEDEREIRQLIDERFGNKLQYTIEYTRRIQRTSNGKLRFVISDVRI